MRRKGAATTRSRYKNPATRPGLRVMFPPLTLYESRSANIALSIEQVGFRLGQEQQLRLDVGRVGVRLQLLAHVALPAPQLDQLPVLLLQPGHLEREVDDGPQVAVVPRLADEAVHLALVD